MKQAAILGASRGLGQALALQISKNSDGISLILSSRNAEKLQALARPEIDKVIAADFTKANDQDRLLNELKILRPEKIFYVAGGGPFGAFESKAWKDHLWSLELNLLFPARLIHFCLVELPKIESLTLVGSAIAQDKADPMAASYCAGKHGLRGLVESIKKENPKFPIHLFAPGYMDTDLLPKNSWPREQGLAESAELVAERLWQEARF